MDFEQRLEKNEGQAPTSPDKVRGRSRWHAMQVAIAGGILFTITTGCGLLGIPESKKSTANSVSTKPVAALDAPLIPTYTPFPTATPKIETPTPITSAPKDPQKPYFVQEDRFLQCTDIAYLPESNLLKDPLTMPNGPKDPQIQHAIDTLTRNRIYDLQAIDLLPRSTKLKFISSMQHTFCLPDEQAGKSRFFIQTSEGSGLNLPYGSINDRLAEFLLPEGLNPLVVTRMGQRYPGSEKIKQEWIFFNLQKNQEIGFRNTNGSSYNIGKGPLAFLTWDQGVRYVDFIKPD